MTKREQMEHAQRVVNEAKNEGHGHVRPRPDGVKARCGGPALCAVCQRELAALAKGDTNG